jgi:serine/threonine protein kinase/DNA-binding SARP family transcriptional activator/WD40 repeat protein
MRICVLGDISAESDGRVIPIVGPQVRRLLAVLALDIGQSVSLDRLVDALYPDGLTEAGRVGNVRTYVFRLRALLGGGILETTAIGYRLVANRDDLDASRFRSLLTVGLRSPTEAVSAIDQALALWPAGRAFAEFADEEWCRAEAASLDELRVVARERRVESRLASGVDRESVADLEALVREYPLREHFRIQLMTALYRSGRQADALRAAHDYRAYLAQETGLDPSSELIELERQIAARDAVLTFVPADQAEQLRGYLVGERIGGGAFGSVFRATQPSIGREVAIKVIKRELIDDPVFVRRFEAEAQLVASLEHAHIVPLYDYWREPSGAYLVMRFLRGGSVEDRLRRGSVSLADVTRLVEGVGSALALAHNRGVVHRDIKPSNLLFDETGDAFLADFGIAVTVVGSGTTQDDAGHFDPLDDQQAFAIVLHRMLGGEANPPETTSAAASPPGPPDRQRSHAVNDVLARACAADPMDRFADMGEFIGAWRTATGNIIEHPMPSRTTRPSNPYKGLRPFREADAMEFFGRATLVEEMEAAVQSSRYVTVVGASGSGKSSAVAAGLAPRLRAAGRFVVAMVPGAHPFDELEAALLRVAVDPPPDLNEQLSRERGLSRVLKRLLPDDGSDAVLVVDQFEEVWTLAGPEERRVFLDNLADAVDDPHSRLRVVAVIRADFYDRPLQHPAIGEFTRTGSVAVSALTAEDLESAISRPAATVGIRTEPALVAEIVGDAFAQAGSLPLVQYALTDLFDRATNDTMTVAAYHAMGGLAGALGRRADELCDSHGEDAVRRMFNRLVTLGDGVPDTRRRARRSELVGVGDAVIDEFGQHRLLTFDRDPITREPTVEVAHEALLRSWPRLAAWLETDRDSLRVLHHLSTAAAAWDTGGRDAGELYQSRHLHAAESFATTARDVLTPVEQSFLDASRHREQRTRRLNRAALATLVALLAVALVTAGVALSQRHVAVRAAADARANADRADVATTKEHDTATTAEIRRVALEARSLAASQPILGMLLAAESYKRLPSDIDTRGALQAALVANPYMRAVVTGPIDEFAREVAVGPAGFAATLWTRQIQLIATAPPFATRSLPGDFQRADDIAFWPDAQTLAVTIEDTLHLIDVGDGHEVTRPFALPTGPISPFGNPPRSVHHLARISDGRLAIDDTVGFTVVSVDHTMVQVPGSFPHGFTGLSAAADAPVVVAPAALGNGAEVIDLGGARPPLIITVPLPGFTGWQVNAGATRLAGGSNSGDIVLVDPNGHELARRNVNSAPVGMFFAPDGRLAVTTIDGRITLCDPNTLGTLATIPLTSVSIIGAVLAPDGRTIVVNNLNGTTILDLDGRGPLTSVADGYTSAALSPDGRRVATVGTNGAMSVLDASTFQVVAGPWQRPEIPAGTSYSMAWTPDGQRFALHGDEGVVDIVDAATGELDTIPTLSTPATPHPPIHFSPDGKHLVILDDVAGIELVDLATKNRIAKAFDPTWGFAVDAVYSPDGSVLAVDTFAGNEELLDGTTLAVTRRCDIRSGYTSWSRDGSRLAVGTDIGEVVIADANCRPLQTFTGSHSPSQPLFSVDGTELFARGPEGTRQYDLASGRQIGAVLPDPDPETQAYNITATGRLFTMATGAHQLLMIDLDPATWLTETCATTGRNLTTNEWNRYLGALGPYQPTCGQYPAPASIVT